MAPAEKQDELALRLADLLIELRRFTEAEDEARDILKNNPDKAKKQQGNRLLALALYGQSRSGSLSGGRNLAAVGEAVETAWKLNPADVDLSLTLAQIYRNQPDLLGPKQRSLPDRERYVLADEVMDKMVAAKPKDAEALLAHHRYQLRYHPTEDKKDLAKAIQDNPDDLAVVLQAAVEAGIDAEKLRRSGGSTKDVEAGWQKAIKLYEHAIELSPAEEKAYLGLAGLYAGTGKLDDADKTLRRGLENAGKDAVGINLRSQLADVEISRGKLDEADKTIAELQRITDQIAPTQPQPVRLALKRTIDSLRGRWLVAKGRYLEAVPVLRRVAAGHQTSAPEVARNWQAWILLGRSYAKLGQWDQAAIAFDEAAALNPNAPEPLLEAAASWMSAGRPDAAEQRYRQALVLDPSAQARLALANVLLQKELLKPAAARNWDAFNKETAEARKSIDGKSVKAEANQPAEGKAAETGAWRLKLLEVDYNLARSQEPALHDQSIRAALKLCREVEKQDADSPAVLPLLAVAYERLDQPADTDRVLKRLETIKGQEAPACLLKARICAARKQYEQARKLLNDGLKTLPEKMRPALRMELVQVERQEGRPDQAREQLLKLHQEQPDKVGWLVQLAETSFASGKLDEARQWETELRKLEGENGPFWRYFQALRLLAEATGPDDSKLAEASKLQDFIQTQRPAWPQAYYLKGLLAEARGNFDQATDAYRESIRLGERNPQAFQRLIMLLLQTNQAGEADHYLSLMQDLAPSNAGEASLESRVAVRRGQTERALESARRGVEQSPKDPQAKLWLGQLLLSARKSAEAEKTLKEAVELAPDDPRTLGGLFVFYVRADRPDDARKILQRIAENKKLSPLQRAALLARGYESLGDRKQALANFREAARIDADNPAAQANLAGYLLRSGSATDAPEAEDLLRGVLKKNPDYGPARRMLAQLLVARGGEQAWQEARRLVEEAGKEGAYSDADRRLQAMILARRGGKANLDQARTILEELVADPKKAADADRRMLAGLYESVGDVEQARRQYLKLISKENAEPADLASYVDLLIRHELFDEADQRLKQLEASRPGDLAAAAVRARWLRGKGQVEKIEPLLEPLAEKAAGGLPKDSPEEANFLLSMGNLYTSLDQYQAAERWYRRLAALRPELYPPLVNALARQGRMKEAVEMCITAAKTDASARPATTAAIALLAGKPSEADFALAEPLLKKALSDHQGDASLLSAVASLRVVQKRLKDAIGLFRQALALKSDNLSALNNLATLLSDDPDKPDDLKEALRYVNQAIEIAGPQPGLLDTKGMILVQEGKAADAVPLLEQAAASTLSDPRYHFHLAVAYDRAGRSDQARAAYRTALKNHLTRQILTPSDKKMLAELKKKFD